MAMPLAIRMMARKYLGLAARATAPANVGAARSAPGRTPGGPAKGSPS